MLSTWETFIDNIDAIRALTAGIAVGDFMRDRTTVSAVELVDDALVWQTVQHGWKDCAMNQALSFDG